MTVNLVETFSTPLLAWYDNHGRKDLPWQSPQTAYRVWISEIMLQQTQVQTVIPYFNRFMQLFPELQDLATAKEDAVMAAWSGLGYYTRARNLHKTAKIINSDFLGVFPQDPEVLVTLPGIGQSTAAAIASQAFNSHAAILDGNVKRVLTRYFMIDGWPEKASVKNQLWKIADSCMPFERCSEYTQAIMDLGATCCTNKNPQCHACPLQETCLARKHEKTRDYPVKNPRKQLPVRQQQFLLLRRFESEIYLEKNPPTGLWSSLWTLPAIDMENKVRNYINEKYGYTIHRLQELDTFKHTFSHFHLTLHPVLVDIEVQDPQQLRESQGKWFSLAEAQTLGLAKPIRTIINAINP